MKKNDSIPLRHMLDSSREALSFVKGKKRTDLNKNRMLVLSLVRSLEVIGEAASHISLEFQQAHPQIPWRQMVGMRNRLIHAYFDVDLDRVWDTVQGDLPGLVTELEKIAT